MAKEAVQEEAVEVVEPKKGFSKKKIGIIAGVAVLQAAAFFGVFKFAQSGPRPAHGEDSHVIENDPTSQPVEYAELLLLKSFKVPNTSSGCDADLRH